MCFVIITVAVCFIEYIFRSIMLHLKSQHCIIMYCILNRIFVQTFPIQFFRRTRKITHLWIWIFRKSWCSSEPIPQRSAKETFQFSFRTWCYCSMTFIHYKCYFKIFNLIVLWSSLFQAFRNQTL